jgi:deoxyadenosine/deoxycytidine kinase
LWDTAQGNEGPENGQLLRRRENRGRKMTNENWYSIMAQLHSLEKDIDTLIYNFEKKTNVKVTDLGFLSDLKTLVSIENEGIKDSD